MTDKEKINRFNIITTIRSKMPDCFAADGLFVTSSLGKENANELKKIIVKNNIDQIIIEDIALGYLFRNNHLTKNFKNQVSSVLDFFYKDQII